MVQLNAAALIDRVRKIALALPDTTEKLSHGEPAFRSAATLAASLLTVTIRPA